MKWESLEYQRAPSRLTLLYKSIHHAVAINSDGYQSQPAMVAIQTRKSSATSFLHPATKKDCYKFSVLPKTMAEWNLRLPVNIRQSPIIDTFKTRLNDMHMSTFIRGTHNYSCTSHHVPAIHRYPPLPTTCLHHWYPDSRVCMQYP